MRNSSDKSCEENQNTHFMFNNFFFENRVVYMRLCKNIHSKAGLSTDVNMAQAHCVLGT
jgi:hypothetical protein